MLGCPWCKKQSPKAEQLLGKKLRCACGGIYKLPDYLEGNSEPVQEPPSKKPATKKAPVKKTKAGAVPAEVRQAWTPPPKAGFPWGKVLMPIVGIGAIVAAVLIGMEFFGGWTPTNAARQFNDGMVEKLGSIEGAVVELMTALNDAIDANEYSAVQPSYDRLLAAVDRAEESIRSTAPPDPEASAELQKAFVAFMKEERKLIQEHFTRMQEVARDPGLEADAKKIRIQEIASDLERDEGAPLKALRAAQQKYSQKHGFEIR